MLPPGAGSAELFKTGQGFHLLLRSLAMTNESAICSSASLLPITVSERVRAPSWRSAPRRLDRCIYLFLLAIQIPVDRMRRRADCLFPGIPDRRRQAGSVVCFGAERGLAPPFGPAPLSSIALYATNAIPGRSTPWSPTTTERAWGTLSAMLFIPNLMAFSTR
jgi:hypothetical protein